MEYTTPKRLLTCYGQAFPNQHYQCEAYMIPNQPKAYIIMYVATMAFVGVTSKHQRSSDTHMIIRHHLRPPPTAQQTPRYNTQRYNTHRHKLQIHLPNLPPLSHVTTLLEMICCGNKLLPVFRPKWSENR